MFSDMIIDILLVMCPILIYFVFSSCDIFISKVYSRTFLIVTLLTSLYFSLTYNVILNYKVLLFCDVPILVAYIRKERDVAVVLSIIMWLVSDDLYSINLFLVIVKYILFLIFYTMLVDKKSFSNYFLILVTIILGFFTFFEYFTVYNKIQILCIVILVYIITCFSVYLFNLADKITNLCKDMQAYVNQEKIKNSLFKLTHEIKNPIAVCKGYLDMLDLDDGVKVHKYIPIVKSEIDRSLNIMSDFMQYSKIKLDVSLLDLTILLDDIYDSFSILLVNKAIDFNYDNIYDEVFINGDYDRLKQVFVNIIKNSVEAIVEKGLINVQVSVIKNMVQIKIIDNGMGISEENINHIKDMFYTTKKNGTGLGVSLSNEIISLHGGKLEYNSVVGVGTTCTVTLPVVRM